MASWISEKYLAVFNIDCPVPSGPLRTELPNFQIEEPGLPSLNVVTELKLFIIKLPTSHPPPESPVRYVADCSRPPKCEAFNIESDVRLSNAAIIPAPFSIALYPPPDIAIP